MRFAGDLRPVTWLCILLALPSSAAQELAANQTSQADVAAQQLMQTAESETQKGFMMAYRQGYASHHRQVRLEGSIYAVLSALRAKDCRVSMNVSVTDLYSGAIGQKPVPNTQAIYRSSTDLALDSSSIASLHVVQRRPVQLESSTHPTCDAPTTCAIPWLEIRMTMPVLRIENETNDVQGYDGAVQQPVATGDRFYVPFSSVEAATAVAARLAALGAACQKSLPDQPGTTLLWLSPGQVH